MDWINAWLFPLGSAVVGGVGLVLVWHGLTGAGVVRRRRSCRRCRYDMTATEGPTCPECGRVHRHEGEHYAGRRRWWLAAVGLVLLLGAVGGSRWVEMRNNGWWSVMPMSIQLRALSFSKDPRLWGFVGRSSGGNSLSAGQDAFFRRVMLERLLDHDRDPTAAISGAEDAIRWTRRPDPVLTRDDLVRIAREGPAAARAFAVDALGYPIPVTDEDLVVRRLAWSEANAPDRPAVLKWIAQHAVGDEDAAILRQAMRDDPRKAARVYEDVVAESTGGLVQVLVGLLDDPDEAVRASAAGCFEDWMRGRDGMPPAAVQRQLIELYLSDPSPAVIRAVGRMVEDMSPVVGPDLGAGLLRHADGDRFQDLLHRITRKDDPGLVVPLLRVAVQPGRPLVQRMEAADAGWYVWRRTERESGDPMPDVADPELIGVYADCVRALRAGQPDLLVSVGYHEGVNGDPWFLRAILRVAGEEGVGADGLAEWLEAGGMGPALTLPHLESLTAAEALRQRLIEQLRATGRDPDGSLRTQAEQWFPGLLGEEPGSKNDADG